MMGDQKSMWRRKNSDTGNKNTVQNNQEELLWLKYKSVCWFTYSDSLRGKNCTALGLDSQAFYEKSYFTKKILPTDFT